MSSELHAQKNLLVEDLRRNVADTQIDVDEVKKICNRLSKIEKEIERHSTHRGENAYNVYAASVGGKAVNGEKLKPWNEMPQKIQEAWIKVEETVKPINDNPKPPPPNPVAKPKRTQTPKEKNKKKELKDFSF